MALLEEARELGFLGPGPVAPHVDHARGFATAAGPPPRQACDLGSGGGLPGLVLALAWPASSWTLLDANHRRTAFLARAVGTLGFGDRVEVRCARAEEAGHEPGVRASFDLVVARGFGPPATAAECAAPLLRVGGRLVVSEPPEPGPERWPEAGLAPLGLHRLASPSASYAVLEQREPCPERFPRRTGVPAKRPLF